MRTAFEFTSQIRPIAKLPVPAELFGVGPMAAIHLAAIDLKMRAIRGPGG